MSQLERQVRSLGRKKFIKFRNTSAGVTAYLPNGVSKLVFENWEKAYGYISNKNE